MFNRRPRIERLEARLPLAADFNGDATVDDLDLRDWSANFGSTSATAAQGDTDGDMDVDGADFLDWQRDLGPKQNNLIAYRPQGIFHPTNPPLDEPRYEPFPRRSVREADEFSNLFGPGIRINLDDDDLSGMPDAFESGYELERENDLIELKVQALAGINVVLVPDARITLYYNHDKQTPIPMNAGVTEQIPLILGELSVWAEWTVGTHGLANVGLQDAQTNESLDIVRFHSFRSLIIAFGGNGQDPHDTDGDGSIGDVSGEGDNREGIFDIAQTMYNTGWDVQAFDEEEVDDPEDIPYTEAVSAEFDRNVDGIAIIGFSQGGGATHDLIERLYSDHEIITRIGVYLDAVTHDGRFAEDRWPVAALHLMNFYEEIIEVPVNFGGGDIDDNEVIAPATLEEYNVNTDNSFPPDLNHYFIDDDPLVQQLIRNRLLQFLVNR